MKKLLYLFVAVATQFSFAQTDEASGAPALSISTTYACENEETGDFTGFTKSAEFTCAGSEYDYWVDAWYTITPSETRLYAIEIEELNGFVFDVRLALFTGTPGNLTNNSGCATRYHSSVLNMGETYYLHVRAAYTATQYRVCVYPFPDTPSNDEPANADTLIESTFEVCENPSTGHTANATFTSEVVCSTSNPDVWYSFTPTETAEYTFKASLLNGATPLYIGIYSGTPGFLNAFVEEPTSPTIQCQDIVLADLTAGTTYYISVTSSNSSRAVYFDLCAYKSPPAPSNDDCTNPTNLTVGATFEDNYIIATNTSASVNPGNSNFPDCGTLPDFGIYGRDIWFTVTVPASGSFTIETRAEPTETNLSDTAMETYTGSCGTGTLTPYYYNLPPPNTGTAFCNDQFVIGGNPYAGILFTDKTPGETVIVRVWAWSYQFGKFRIGAYDPNLLSTETFDTNSFSYFPNPTNNILNINYNQNINKVTVNNLLGQTVLTREANNKSIALDVSNLATGIYIVTVNSGNTSTNFKVVKR
ncbi:T9SS type A sorting domain-containing protein [Xanthomarina sp. GH4-25]